LITGCVILEEDLLARRLDLIIRGFEETRFWRKLVQQQKRYLVQDIKRRDFLRQTFELSRFEEGIAQANLYSF
jgi:hypothetical protein